MFCRLTDELNSEASKLVSVFHIQQISNIAKASRF